MDPSLRLTIFGAVLATAVAGTWAAYELRNTLTAPSFKVQPAAQAVPVRADPPEASRASTPSSAVEPGRALDPNERIVQPAPRKAQPRITITRPRLTPDQRIQAEVMERIAGNRTLSGKIRVESRNRVVRLSGWTPTPGQALRAERQARRVPGVRHVVNEIRPRIGPVTS